MWVDGVHIVLLASILFCWRPYHAVGVHIVLLASLLMLVLLLASLYYFWKNLFRIQGSKRHRIPDPDPQHWNPGLPNIYKFGLCRISTLCFLPRVRIHTPRQKSRREGGLRQIYSCRKVPFQIIFQRKHFALPSMSLIFLRCGLFSGLILNWSPFLLPIQCWFHCSCYSNSPSSRGWQVFLLTAVCQLLFCLPTTSCSIVLPVADPIFLHANGQLSYYQLLIHLPATPAYCQLLDVVLSELP